MKLQILNLAAKLCITNSKQTRLLCQYVFNLAKYDQNYDIRDRSRFLRQLVIPAEKGPLAKYAKKIFLATKPAPVLQSKFHGMYNIFIMCAAIFSTNISVKKYWGKQKFLANVANLWAIAITHYLSSGLKLYQFQFLLRNPYRDLNQTWQESISQCHLSRVFISSWSSQGLSGIQGSCP